MSRISAFFLFLLLVSCDVIGTKKPNREELIQQEMQSINWNDVDRYPLFEGCSETDDKEDQKICFQNTFIKHFMDTLQEQHIVVHKSLNDTVDVHLLISKDGEVTIAGINTSERVVSQIPKIDSLIEVSLERLPKLYPALKRNIPVATKLRLPIVLKVD